MSVILAKRIEIVLLVSLVLASSALAGELPRQRENPKWTQALDLMNRLRKTVAEASLRCSSEVETAFRTAAEQWQRLWSLSGTLDTDEASLEERNRAVEREAERLRTKTRLYEDQNRREEQDLKAWFDPRQAELNAEKARLREEKQRIKEAARNGQNVQEWVADWRRRGAQHNETSNRFASEARRRNDAFLGKWERLREELNREIAAFEARRQQLQRDWDQFAVKNDRYNESVTEWETSLEELARTQDQEIERVRAQLADSQRPVPDLQRKRPKLSDALKPQTLLDTTKIVIRETQNLTIDLANDSSRTISLLNTVTSVGAIASKKAVPAPVQVAFLSAKGMDAVLEAAKQAADNIDTQETQIRRRALPSTLGKSPIVRQLARENVELQRQVEAGEISEHEKRRRLDERTQRLLGQRKPILGEEDYLARYLFSHETAKGLAEFVASEVMSNALASRHKETLKRFISPNDPNLDNVAGLIAGIEFDFVMKRTRQAQGMKPQGRSTVSGN